METEVRLKLNIAVLILNDNSYGMIRWKQANMGFRNWTLTYGTPTSSSMRRATAPTAIG